MWFPHVLHVATQTQQDLYARFEPIINPSLSQEKAGFQRGWSIADQATFLAQDIEDSLSAERKSKLCFSILPAA